MADHIYIRDLALQCIVGVNPDERTQKQGVVLNLAMECDLAKAGGSDELRDTVDYMAIKKQIVALVESSEFFLIERLAQGVADVCLENPRVKSVTVTVDKPGALTRARSVAVEIWRRNRAARRKRVGR